MAIEQLNGFLLHRRAYRETSYLVSIFTLERGRVSAVVKGVRGSKSDKKSLLQPFQALLINVSGKHELKNLQQVESTASRFGLTGQALFSAMYLNEVLNRLLAVEIPQPEIFSLYQHSLHALTTDGAIEPILRQFELGLLDELGYGLDLAHDSDSAEPLESDGYYQLIPEQGLRAVSSKLSSPYYFNGSVLLQVARGQWDNNSLHCAKRITRIALAQLLGSKPLMSRELFKQTHFVSKGK